MIDDTTRVSGIQLACYPSFNADNTFERWIDITLCRKMKIKLYSFFLWILMKFGESYKSKVSSYILFNRSYQGLVIFYDFVFVKSRMFVCGISWNVPINAQSLNKAIEVMGFANKNNFVWTFVRRDDNIFPMKWGKTFKCLTIVWIRTFMDTFLEIVKTIPNQRSDSTYPIWQRLDLWFLVLFSCYTWSGIISTKLNMVLKLSFKLRRWGFLNFEPRETT